MSDPEQARAALRSANAARAAHTALRREVAAGGLTGGLERAIVALSEPGAVSTIPLGRLFSSIPGFGASTVARVLAYAGVGHRTRPCDLTNTRRGALIYALQRGRLRSARNAPEARFSLSREL